MVRVTQAPRRPDRCHGPSDGGPPAAPDASPGGQPRTRQIAASVSATGMVDNKAAAKTGGRIAKKARLELEAKTGQKVVTPENYLPPTKTAKQVK